MSQFFNFCDRNVVFVLIQPCFSQLPGAGKRSNILVNFLLRLQAGLSFQTYKESAVVNTTEIWVFASLDPFWRCEARRLHNFHHGESVHPSGSQVLASSREPLLTGRTILVAALAGEPTPAFGRGNCPVSFSSVTAVGTAVPDGVCPRISCALSSAIKSCHSHSRPGPI